MIGVVVLGGGWKHAINKLAISAKIQENWNNEIMDWGGAGDGTMDVGCRGGMERKMKDAR